MSLSRHETRAVAFGSEPMARGPQEIRDYVLIIRSRKIVIFVFAAVMVWAALCVSVWQDELYVSRASVLVGAPSGERGQAPAMATEKRLAVSTAVAAAASQKLGNVRPEVLVKGLSLSVPVDTSILIFRYSHPLPREAQRRAQAFAEAFGEVRSQASVSVQVVDSANLPTKPAQPKTARNLIVALVVGAMLGVAFAFLRDHLDDGIRGAPDLEARLHAPVLGVITADRTRRRSTERPPPVEVDDASVPKGADRTAHLALLALTDGDPRMVEAFRRAANNLLLATRNVGARSVLISSSREEESKTFTAANLGVILAAMGVKVVLVSADLHNRHLDRVFDVEKEPGLTDVLLTDLPMSDALRESAVDNLHILPAGLERPLLSVLMDTRTMAEIIRTLETQAELVLVDSVPLLTGFADATAIAPCCDVTLLVADTRYSTRSILSEASRELEHLGVALIGSVLLDGLGGTIRRSTRVSSADVAEPR